MYCSWCWWLVVSANQYFMEMEIWYFFFMLDSPYPIPPQYLHNSKCQGFLKYFGMLWTKTKKHIRMLVIYMFIQFHYSVDEVWSTYSAGSHLVQNQVWSVLTTSLYISVHLVLSLWGSFRWDSKHVSTVLSLLSWCSYIWNPHLIGIDLDWPTVYQICSVSVTLTY